MWTNKINRAPEREQDRKTYIHLRLKLGLETLKLSLFSFLSLTSNDFYLPSSTMKNSLQVEEHGKHFVDQNTLQIKVPKSGELHHFPFYFESWNLVLLALAFMQLFQMRLHLTKYMQLTLICHDKNDKAVLGQ